jgi:hypothetical protein
MELHSIQVYKKSRSCREINKEGMYVFVVALYQIPVCQTTIVVVQPSYVAILQFYYNHIWLGLFILDISNSERSYLRVRNIMGIRLLYTVKKAT